MYDYQRLHALSWIYEDFGPTANELEGEKSGALRSDGGCLWNAKKVEVQKTHHPGFWF